MAADCGTVDLPSSVLQQIFAAMAGQPDSLPDLCCCLCICQQWKEAASCKENWRNIDVPFSKADKITSTHLEKLVSRSSDQVLSVKLPGCHKVRTYSIMHVLLHNQQLEEVGVHNVEFFLQELLARPNPKLKHLTAGSGGNHFWGLMCDDLKLEARAAGILLHEASDMPR